MYVYTGRLSAPLASRLPMAPLPSLTTTSTHHEDKRLVGRHQSTALGVCGAGGGGSVCGALHHIHTTNMLARGGVDSLMVEVIRYDTRRLCDRVATFFANITSYIQ